jgi:hypothetical protein
MKRGIRCRMVTLLLLASPLPALAGEPWPFPWPEGRSQPPKDGDVWRMDFSRFNQ